MKLAQLWTLVSLAALFSCEDARGDMGFGPRQQISIRLFFEELPKLSEYDFYLKYEIGARAHVTKLDA